MNFARSQFLQKSRSFICNYSRLLRLAPQFRPYSNSSTIKQKEEEEENRPVKFSTSQAHKWQASFSRKGVQNHRLWYEPYVILASLSVFLIYFTIFREENDIDQELTRTLYSRIQGLEEHQLRVSLEYNRDNNLPTQDIIKRLEKIENDKHKSL